jgi:hypothetical protein
MTEPQRPDDQATIEELPTAPAFTPTSGPVPNHLAADDSTGTTAPRRRRRVGLRWLVAVVGIVLIVASSVAIVVLAAGGAGVTSVAMGYVPTTAVSYAEAKLDLPGDQKQKLGEFLKTAFPGFDDQSQLDVKLDELLDRLTQAATNGKHTWSTEIAPWFGGQVGVAMDPPDPNTLTRVTTVTQTIGSDVATVSGGTTPGMSRFGSVSNGLIVITIKDRAKAEAWLATVLDQASTNKSAYNGADLYVNADSGSGHPMALAVTDKVILGGSEPDVKAAVDTNGNGTFASQEDVKAALATIKADIVGFAVVRTRASLDASLRMVEQASPGTLGNTQVDDTLLAMVPAWQAESARFESDALSVSSASPPWAIGYDPTNRTSTLTSHVPASSVAYGEVHDVGKALSAILGKLRALPETKEAFQTLDQALAVLGGFDAVFGWWGDTAFDVAPGENGTIGAGLVIKPTDAAAATRFFTTLKADVQLAAQSAGIIVRDEDHNGTTITTLDLSGVQGMSPKDLPAGYKAEISWAVNQDVAVIGYGYDFVEAVLDAGPGHSLADDARFRSLVDRVGADNTGLAFVDVAAMRRLLEPLYQQKATPEKWANYEKEIKPYLEHFDAAISATHRDGSLERGSGQLTVR